MVRRISFGLVWLFVLYFGIATFVGGVAGGIAGANAQPDENPAILGQEAGARAVEAYFPWIVLSSLSLSIIGTMFGFLPGTHKSRPPVPVSDEIIL